MLPHYYKEYDVPLLMTVPNAYGAESFDWVDELITHPIRMKDGFAYPNEGAGVGPDRSCGPFTPGQVVCQFGVAGHTTARTRLRWPSMASAGRVSCS